ncbi:hypothetical protein [Caulobacter sp. 17J80-11]|uniref:hypothetical protein n=1 Tax=Caulobacter sp. 17J80-11 TaxID=2763502 RepID=UPI00165381CC|nr:hypothetical protein [Caulobacter sp. 17J80-11]MBC6982572.1 hypothetical protein [Caulobacter sp. 17J80-11]
MEYLIGAGLALGVALLGALTRHDRRRAYYPLMLVVIAGCYDVFAIRAGSASALGPETLGLVAFAILAAIGFRTSLWVVVVGLIAHGLFDLLRGDQIANPGVPVWWPPFCFAYDLATAAWLAQRLLRARSSAPTAA